MSYSELDTCLSGDYGVDNWADNVSEYAQELVGEFSSEDWDELENNFSARPVQWRNYLAQILSWGDHKKAVPILISLLLDDNEETAISAADSLRDISENSHPVKIDTEVAEHLKKIAASTQSDISSSAISAFLNSAIIN